MTVGIALISLVVFLFFCLMCVGYYRTSWTPGFTGTRTVIPRRVRPSRVPGLAKGVIESLPIVRFEDRRGRDVELGERLPGVRGQDNSSRQGVVGVGVRSIPDKASRNFVKSGGVEVTAISSTSFSLSAEVPGEFNCSICLEDFIDSEEIRLLPCDHKFHPKCVDPWLHSVSGTCPIWFVKSSPFDCEVLT